jgi:hypothetical protein
MIDEIMAGEREGATTTSGERAAAGALGEKGGISRERRKRCRRIEPPPLRQRATRVIQSN